MAYIYAINGQLTDDVAVRRNIAKDTSWVWVRVKAFALECALGLCYEFDPRSGIATHFDPRRHSVLSFWPFLPGLIALILLKQSQDAIIQSWVQKHSQSFQTRQFDDNVNLITHVKQGDDPNMDSKIVLPENIINQVIKRFHQVLGHPGNNRMRDAIQATYYHPNLRKYIDNFTSGICQKHKLSGRQYGLLPERDVRTHPWQEVVVGLIGPWTVEIRGQSTPEC